MGRIKPAAWRGCVAAVAASLLLASPLASQAIVGYSARSAVAQRALERSVSRRPDAARATAHSRALSARSHIAGTPAQAITRDYVLDRMREWGLETEMREYQVWMPHTTEARVWRVAPDTLELVLAEGPVPGDSITMESGQIVMANGYSGAGDVSGEVVYVNYGLIEDYARLESLGVSVRGKVAIARYGRSFRGIKAREAERNGAAALVLYSDPADDGFTRGDVYPDGPMRPATGVQRGSVMNGTGDPTTPGWASVRGARRLPLDSVRVPRIPVIPISWSNAAELLRDIRGTAIPQEWQGGLPFRYHIGPGPVRARVVVRLDTAANAIKSIWNTYGTIRGATYPDQLIVLGAHRDSWGPGAVDDVSGTVSVLEAARAVAEEVRAGRRPKRTIVFATWDAEEWGLIGSTEYVEQDSARLTSGGIAYLNQDVAVGGPSFGSGGSPSLRAVLRDVVKGIDDPSGRGTIYAAWRAGAAVADTAEPAMGDPGGGSDFAGFYNHLGIPHLDWGFGGPGGVYHSAYDTFEWMSRFGDPDFRRHAAAARIGATLALRLANADVLPYDYVEFARTMKAQMPLVERAVKARGWDLSVDSLARAIDRMERAAMELAQVRDAALAQSSVQRRATERANAALLRVERALTRPEGLRTRPWYRGLIYAADENNGYSTMALPSVNEAIRASDRGLAAREVADLAGRFAAATRALEEAAVGLRGR
ncbi:MAG TPA: M20/M25/M40 family metallo-hydrolase [Gemmatimonadaceae bacterium]|nr:M20/M25/M40 family metallo-hydrolase [Gemmatimonadaceae bacterium]